MTGRVVRWLARTTGLAATTAIAHTVIAAGLDQFPTWLTASTLGFTAGATVAGVSVYRACRGRQMDTEIEREKARYFAEASDRLVEDRAVLERRLTAARAAVKRATSRLRGELT